MRGQYYLRLPEVRHPSASCPAAPGCPGSGPPSPPRRQSSKGALVYNFLKYKDILRPRYNSQHHHYVVTDLGLTPLVSSSRGWFLSKKPLALVCRSKPPKPFLAPRGKPLSWPWPPSGTPRRPPSPPSSSSSMLLFLESTPVYTRYKMVTVNVNLIPKAPQNCLKCLPCPPGSHRLH